MTTCIWKYRRTATVLAVFFAFCIMGGLQPALAEVPQPAAGKVLQLGPGEYDINDLQMPAGSTIRGAGYKKTVLDATDHRTGILVNADDVTICDLTIRGADEAAIKVQDAANLTVRNVLIRNNLVGLLMHGADNARIENAVFARNRTGASLSSCRKSAVVNCTFGGNTILALGITGSKEVAAFNNVFANSPNGVYLADNSSLALDYNLYMVNFIAKLAGEQMRTTIEGWQSLTGHDRHSVCAEVEFADAANNDLRAVSPCMWLPTHATTGNLAAAGLAGFDAPALDIDGRKRSARDVGAYNVQLPCDRKPAGRFTIQSSEGVKSAGLFTTDGFNVAYLFQNLPLAKGTYDFYLPTRDFQGRPISSGQYELRLAESNLGNEYITLAGNFAASSKTIDNCSWGESMYAFDSRGRIFIAQGWTENHMGIRAFDPEYKKPLWVIQGESKPLGMTTSSDYLYILNVVDGQDSIRLRKIELGTGKIMPIEGKGQIELTQFSSAVFGLALLNNRLFISDPGKNKIFYAPVDKPEFAASFDVPEPSSITADAATGLLWVISGEKLIALDPQNGTVRTQFTPAAAPDVISASNGSMAILSRASGKIHIMDVTDAGNPTETRTIGTGDGPFGPIRPDRFWFQQAPGMKRPPKANVAISQAGAVAVVDGIRVSYWSPDGKLKKRGIGFWGQNITFGKLAGDTDMRFWGMSGDYSFKVDSKTRTWQPDTYWQLPDYPRSFDFAMGFFTAEGRNFGLYHTSFTDPDNPKRPIQGIAVVEFDGFVGKARCFYASERPGLTVRYDDNNDGIINEKDAPHAVTDDNGKPAQLPYCRYYTCDLAGNIILACRWTPTSSGAIIPFTGFDANGNPLYNWTDPRVLTSVDKETGKAQIISPYDLKTPEQLNRWVMQVPPLSDGGYVASIGLKTSGGTGLANGAGTDVVGYTEDGRVRWFHHLAQYAGTEGVQTLPSLGLVLTMTITDCTYLAMDEDGLGLGALGLPPESEWSGMWADHATQQRVWIGNDGKPYYMLGDYVLNGYHWLSITGTDTIRHSRVPVTIDAARADVLAALPAVTVPNKGPAPPTPKVTIPRLAEPMPIDGDLAKWRNAGIQPMAIVTPENATGGITGPTDCSGIIRVAYQGDDLYVQSIVFDDIVTNHQPPTKMYQSDVIEMAINGFMEGFKYNMGLTAEGPTVFREKAFTQKFTIALPEQEAPRVIRILDNARNVEERKIIEAIYGVDLTNNKVIVTELKLPLTPKVAYTGGGEQGMPRCRSGESFWLGFFIDDNDVPGSDVQGILPFPPTYGAFNLKEQGAYATFE